MASTGHFHICLVYIEQYGSCLLKIPVASFTKEVNQRLAKRPLKINGRLANRRLASLVKEATDVLLINVQFYEPS